MGLIYRPKHPQSNENGMVDRSLVFREGEDPHFYVISDEMTATRHMADGHHYTSKARFRQATKDAGCVEIGTDSSLYTHRKPVPLSRNQRVSDIKQAIEQLRSNR